MSVPTFVHCIEMRNPFTSIRQLIVNFGLVEQAQVVASTAVIVTMATIVAAILLTGETLRWTDFISVLAVGLIGFFSVVFSLKYARQLDEQRRQLLAISTIAEAVNRSVELEHVLQSALNKATELLNTRFGWIYLLDEDGLLLKSSKGTSNDFIHLPSNTAVPLSVWLHQPRVQRERLVDGLGHIDADLKELGIQFWASIPLKSTDAILGVLIVAGEEFDMFSTKQAELMEAFGNQISVALNNARLFDRVKRSEQLYLDLFENSPDIYLSISRDHTITGCNNTGARMLGYTKEELIGGRLENFFVEELRPTLEDILIRMFLEARGVRDLEEQMVCKDGKLLFVNVNSSLVFDKSGTPVLARIVARDISERKRMESAILHAQKIDSIGNLAGGIAHDFNNILAAILGSASIMRRHMPEDHELAKYVAIIEGAARRGSSLTRQLLTFARKTENVVKPVELHPLIEETLILFERSVSKEIVVEKHFTDDPANINGDEGQVQQALLNVLLNSRDAMPDGGTVRISTGTMMADAHTISQFSSVKPGRFVALTITDTGVGMDEKMKTRVFEPWFTTKEFGTGLGLSVVYGVVQSHGGFISVESEVGKGTSFTMYFPASDAKAKAEAHKRRQRLPRGTENVLIIDDEESVCEIAKDMLSNLGYTVHYVHDGKAGVEMYRTRRATIDLVMMNMNMPLMGGRETLRQLKMISSELPILIVTGHGRAVVDEAVSSSDISGYLQKPFQLEDLAFKVRHVLDNRLQSVPSP
ncbi:MAG: PAS domain S-box protein [Bacteroidetes bacterium]|nr:PAS domain S-box protein [Bacteroidota bacterium]MCW5895577.1 PAS domain S-box protein [Bacteroidota bacterium]